MTETRFYVYVLISSIDGKIFYVGKGKGYRCYQHVWKATKGGGIYHVHRKIRKILKNGGTVSPKKVFFSEIESECLIHEQQLIAQIGRENLTNHTEGGEGSSGYRHTPEAIEKCRALRLGKKLTQESITKRTASWRANGNVVWNKGKGRPKPPPQLHRKMTELNRQLLIEAAMKPKTPLHRLHLSISKSSPIMCIETGAVYRSSKEASKAHGVSGAAIRYAAIHNIRSAGFHWKRIAV